jgi:predicted nucleic acid-binding protein
VTSAPFFDTSVLLAGLIDLGPSSIPAQQLMTAVADGKLRRVHTAWHCCLEFYAVATRLPEELRLHPTDAWRLIDEELLARFAVHQLAADQQRSFLAGVAEERIAGGRVYDAHIAEIARQARVGVVVTDNVRHFTGLTRQGVRVATAADFAREVTR